MYINSLRGRGWPARRQHDTRSETASAPHTERIVAPHTASAPQHLTRSELSLDGDSTTHGANCWRGPKGL